MSLEILKLWLKETIKNSENETPNENKSYWDGWRDSRTSVIKKINRLQKLKLKNYIGITGCPTESDLIEILSLFGKYNISIDYSTHHIPMLGFLVDNKTIKEKFNPKKAYPDLDELTKMLVKAKGNVFSTIHYNSKNNEFDELIYFLDDFGYSKIIDGIQFNFLYPDPKKLLILKEKFPFLKFIFQLHKGYFEKYGGGYDIIRYIKKTYYMMDYILFDSSRGKGVEITSPQLKDYAQIGYAFNEEFKIGIAGGLKAHNLNENLDEMSKHFGTLDFSFDAQSCFWNKNGEFDLSKVDCYLKKYNSFLNRWKTE